MDPNNDEQTEILRNIWNDMKALNGRIDQTNARLDRNNETVKHELGVLGGRVDAVGDRVDGVCERLDSLTERVDGISERLDGLTLEVRAVRTATQSGFELFARNDNRRDRDLDELRGRVDRIEEHVGLRAGT